jgi:light-regulated signal transduction histidine kinase (bacteriophytochrome)
MRWRLEHNIAVWFLLALAITAAIVALAFRNARQLREDQESVTHTHEVLEGLEQAIGLLQEAESAQRAYLFSGDETYLAPLNTASDRFAAQLDRLIRLTADNPEQQRRFTRLGRLGHARIDILWRRVRTLQEQGVAAARRDFALGLGTQKMAETYGVTAEIRQVEQALLTLGLAYYFLRRELAERRRAEADVCHLNEVLEARVAERTAELAASNRELEAFAYSVSHDLRAPLRHIIGFANWLREETALNEAARQHLQGISDAALRMGHLIDDLLSFSRLKRVELRRGPVNLKALVQDARHELQPEATGREIDWLIGDLPVVVGDASLLRLAFINLLSNALKFTRPRQPAQIEIGCADMNEHAAVCYVRDNGVGFDMRYIEKLFGVFERLHRARDFEGTGIGLANTRRIIERHGGRIWAEGKVGAGATFYFTLPRHDKGIAGNR